MANQTQIPTHMKFSGELANINRRLRLIEEHIDSLRSHVEMLDSNLVEKHKANTDDVREVETSIRALREEVKENKELMERVINKLSEFASKESLKVLEKYINYWSPLHYVTKEEVEDIFKEKIKGK